MTSTASSTSSSPTDPTPAPDSDGAREHDPGDATVTEQPVTPRFTDRAAARAAQTGQPAPTAKGSGTAAATPTAAPTAASPTDATAAITAADQEKARRSPGLRAGARRAASLTKTGVNRLRTLLGEIVWVVCLLAAAALVLGTAVVVLEANTQNALVAGVLKAADWADLGVFSRTAGIKQFTGENAVIKNAFVNWGLGAVAWLVVGRIARRFLTP